MDALSRFLPLRITEWLEECSEPAVVVGRDHRILATNAVFEAVFGHVDLCKPLHCFEISHGYGAPCHEAGEDCPLEDALASEQPQRRVHVHRTLSGEVHVDEETVPIRDEAGEIAYFLQRLRPTHIASAIPAKDGMIGRSAPFNRMVELIHRVARGDTTVLLLGETGTGKELAARAVHDASARQKRPFVPVDCSGLPATLFESELFGHEKGSFTGAHGTKPGLVEAAKGGTLFLDEIGDVPLALQVKLLRLLETKSFRRVGSVETRPADFRLVCATLKDLRALCDADMFRLDLFYRINAFPITIPPLRERRADIPLLAEVMLQRLAGDQSPRLEPETLACLAGYAFPGNVRELKQILERALLLTDGNRILPSALPIECRGDAAGDAGEILSLDEVEKRYLRRLRATYRGDKRTLARKLGISKRTLYRKLQEL
jgi:two-component system, NtrC family, response regulator HydG